MTKALRSSITLTLFISLLSLCVFVPYLSASVLLKEASYYTKLDNLFVQCQLCPRRCHISSGSRGYCGVRENQEGTLYTLSFSRPVSINTVDPIEKKPLFHFLPGTLTFSIATAGCNLKCKFCQNWEISQRKPDEIAYEYLEPESLVQRLKDSGRPTIAYTYSEPTIFFEYMLEIAKRAKLAGVHNVMHSNGYINPQPLRELAPYLDAANIDLKGFSDDYYAKLTEGSLEPVLTSLKILKESGVHVEITNLLLPGFNDNEDMIRQMCTWIKDNLGVDTPLHFSRFFPMYKLTYLNPTPVAALERARDIARACGLRYVYIGNVEGKGYENTVCPKCGNVIVERRRFVVMDNKIKDGKCSFCGEEIYGRWN